MTIKAVVFDAYGTLYDVQSISSVLEEAFPGHSDYITQVWRIKQLEYSWLRSLMGRYEDFQTITRESLTYTLETIGLAPGATVVDQIVDAYDTLSPYPEAAEALAALAGYRLAILSNGSSDMLNRLVENSGLSKYLEAVISVDGKQTYKPDPRAYALVQERLGVQPEEVVFVTSNGFDVAGARSFGFKVARIERVTKVALQQELVGGAQIGPSAMFRALRSQTENLGYLPDAVVSSLLALPGLVQRLSG